MCTTVVPRLITFETEEHLHDHAERLNQIGVDPDVPIIDANGHAVLACRTAPGGDGWGFSTTHRARTVHAHPPAGSDCCGGNDRTSEWKPTFPVTGLVCYDLSGTEAPLMPIRPENRDRYPKDWPEISRRIRFERAQGRCECEGECLRGTHLDRCMNVNGQPAYGTGSRVVLTVAHLNHTPRTAATRTCAPCARAATCTTT